MPSLVDAVIAPGQVSRTEQPLLRADSIVLRPWVFDDAPDVVAAYQESDIQRWHARSMTLAEAQRWIADAAWPGLPSKVRAGRSISTDDWPDG
jgi:[ribosomal protein S5]-alanine N-acetyltransferase